MGRWKRLYDYQVSDHKHLVGGMLELFQQLDKRILGLSPHIRQQINKYYIAYKMGCEIMRVSPRKSLLILRLKIIGIADPLGWCHVPSNYNNIKYIKCDIQLSAPGCY